jgi:hypothetical protein
VRRSVAEIGQANSGVELVDLRRHGVLPFMRAFG